MCEQSINTTIMDKKLEMPSLSKLFKASESKRNTAYDALSEEFDDDYQRLLKEMIEIVGLINPTRANKYRLQKLVVEYGYKCETIEDLKICLDTLKSWDNIDVCDSSSDSLHVNVGKDEVDEGFTTPEINPEKIKILKRKDVKISSTNDYDIADGV